MKHVFVETNFVIDVLRPLPTPEAEQLLSLNGSVVTLYLPWCSVTEAKRTLDRVVREDLAFIDNAGRFLGRVMQRAPRPPPAFHANVVAFIDKARVLRRERLYDVPDSVDDLAAKLSIIPPSDEVVKRTMKMFATKSLPPFDEMVLGAVLEKAAELHGRGQGPILFCNRNKNDFTPTTGNELAKAYGDVGIEYRDSFDVS